MVSSRFLALLATWSLTTQAHAIAAKDAAPTTPGSAGGVLFIPEGASSPDTSMLASRDECTALLNGVLPSTNSIPTNFNYSGNVRTYYVRAEQVTWNYAPSGW